MKQKTVTYKSVNDDFFGADIEKKPLEDDFVFVRRGPVWRLASTFVYRFIAWPIVYAFCKITWGLKIVNRKALLPFCSKGIFVYGNHTSWGDVFVSNLVATPHRGYIVAGAETTSIRGLKHLVMMLGAIPIPTSMKNMGKFNACVEYRYKQNGCICIYPEAHIWPYYTGIRPFPDTSFRYPCKLGAPVFAQVTTFKRRRFTGTPKWTVHISDPLYPDMSMPLKERQKKLHDEVYDFMVKTAEEAGSVEFVRYEPDESLAEA